MCTIFGLEIELFRKKGIIFIYLLKLTTVITERDFVKKKKKR